MQAKYEEILKEYFPSYHDFELEEKESILEEVFLRKYYHGEEIVEEFFNPLDSLVIIVEGSVNILAEDGSIETTLKEGDFFGETAPLYKNN
jgi:signal-transduction protein with cAMP-binding, CBS, and nucleotidyltransferase domain